MVPAVVDHSKDIVPIDVVPAVVAAVVTAVVAAAVVQIDFSPMGSGTISSRGACGAFSARLSGDW